MHREEANGQSISKTVLFKAPSKDIVSYKKPDRVQIYFISLLEVSSKKYSL